MSELDATTMPRPARARFVAATVVAVLLFGLLAGRLFQLQVVEGARYAAQAVAARTIEMPIRSSRGLIFDREGRPVAVNTPSWTLYARLADLPGDGPARSAVLARAASLSGVGLSALRERLAAFRGSPFELVPLATEIDRDAALLIAEEAARLPGISVGAEARREYLDETGALSGELLAHLVGYTGPVSRSELEDLSAVGYLRDDVIGRDGVEASYEKELRGTYGSDLLERDASGRPVKVLERLRDPVPGKNLVLTIDARIQRIATETLKWGLEAAGVAQGVTIVMNPQTGEILAMVSLPTYDNNTFAAGISATDYAAYLADPTKPLRNHAISDIYPPGSTFKLVTGLAALDEGVTTVSQRWPTYGCYQIPDAPAGQCLFDWNHRGFGPLSIVDAYAKSSDTFFYQMAVGLGVERLGGWARELGFGEKSGIRLPTEAAGTVISKAWAQAQGRPDVFTGELAQAGIGQNAIAVTPLQLLNAYAAVANGGHLMRPMIVRGETDGDGNLIRAYAPEVIRDLAASAADLQTMRIGAREVITTGHATNINALRVPGALSGKTGTAEFGTPTSQGVLPFHSWFVAYLPSKAGATDADLAIVTFTYSAVVRGNVSLEVIKYFFQEYFNLDQDLRREFQVNAN
ncbi:MAG TPA: penicillin-binding protein 2 [Methylomirabilota bacterium]|nr:penicillin-binding protein 2 [Methylomirabilota bacterium]